MKYLLAVDYDCDNPNPHAMTAGEYFDTEKEAQSAGELLARECMDYGWAVVEISTPPQILRVREIAIGTLAGREREFLCSMITNSGDASDIVDSEEINLDSLELDALRDLYRREDIYDAVWCSYSESLAADNARHEEDDYYEGYEQGAGMVLSAITEVFGLTQEQMAQATR
jgi:hypothetical protein